MDQATSRSEAGFKRPDWVARALLRAVLFAAAALVGLFISTQSASASETPDPLGIKPAVSTTKDVAKEALPRTTAKESRPVPTAKKTTVTKPVAKVSEVGRRTPTEVRNTATATVVKVEATAKKATTELDRTTTVTKAAVVDTVDTVDSTAKPVADVVRSTRTVRTVVEPTLNVVDTTLAGVVDPVVEDVVEPTVDAVWDGVGAPGEALALPTLPPLAASPDSDGPVTAPAPVVVPVPAPAEPTRSGALAGAVAPRAQASPSPAVEQGDGATFSTSVGSVSVPMTTVEASTGGSPEGAPMAPLAKSVAPASSSGSTSGGATSSPVGVVSSQSMQHFPPMLAETEFQKSSASAEGVRPGHRPA